MVNVGDIVREVNTRPNKERIRGIVIKKDISDNQENTNTFNIVLFCFTSACALYARQALAFLPISCM